MTMHGRSVVPDCPLRACRCYTTAKTGKHHGRDDRPRKRSQTDSPYAWRRLACTGLISTIGGVGMWSFVVVLPAVQADFGVDRAAASLPYTAADARLWRRRVSWAGSPTGCGIVPALLIAITSLGAGFVLSGFHHLDLAARAGARAPDRAVRASVISVR